MGLNLFNRRQETQEAGPKGIERANEWYNNYLPRVFAYVHSCVGGQASTEDIVVQAFGQAFTRADTDEDNFRTTLFQTAHRLCRPALKNGRAGDGDSLDSREHEVISLVFDAGLTRNQIARLIRLRETKVNSLLMSGLRKLKEQTSPAAATAYLNLA